MIVLKDDDLPSVNEEFDALSKLQPENRLVWRTGKEAQIKQAFRWADDIAYVDSDKEGTHLIGDRVFGDQTRQGGTKENDQVQMGYQLPCLV
jgi:hypothetical protein